MKYVLLAASLLGFWACDRPAQTAQSQDAAASQDAAFDNYKNRFVEELWTYYPEWATSLGYHRNDSLLTIPDPATDDVRLRFIRLHLDSLKAFRGEALNGQNGIDKLLIENFLRSGEWNITTLKSQEWDPSQYNYGSSVADILNNKSEKTGQKVNNICAKLGRIHAYFRAAKESIKTPTREHTELAISQLKGTVNYLQTAVADTIASLPSDKSAAQTTLNKAVEATNQFIAHLESLLKDMDSGRLKPRDFRLGKALYDQKFAFEIQSGFSADEVFEKALARKGELHKEMAVIAKRLWPKYMAKAPMPADDRQLIKMVIDAVSKTHVKREDFQKEIEREMPILTAFVKQKNLVYLDPSKPLVVRKEPEWMAGVAGASISSPGPYDKNGNTYYNVGSLAAYSPEAAESYLREYNKYTLQILNIHEAIPGHYAQLVYSNQSPSLIKSIFGNGAMVEGWAVYAERMMMEEGWGRNTEINGKVEEDEMWLMYYKWHLRTVCNTILDHSVHVLGMSKEDGLKLLMDEAFQEQAEAEGKWRRVTLTQVQLCSYFTGYAEIFAFRESLKKKEGNQFDLKKFHEQFLSYGSAPVKYIKELMDHN